LILIGAEIDRIRPFDRNSFYYKNLETNGIEKVVLRYSQFSPKKIFRLPDEEEIIDFFIDNNNSNKIYIIGMTKEVSETPLFIKELQIDGNQKGKIVRTQEFEMDDPKVAKLFQAANQVASDLFIGDHFVFKWLEGQVEMFENIFGIDTGRQVTSYTSPIVDSASRRLAYMIKSKNAHIQAVVVPFLSDRRIILDSKKSKRQLWNFLDDETILNIVPILD